MANLFKFIIILLKLNLIIIKSKCITRIEKIVIYFQMNPFCDALNVVRRKIYKQQNWI